MEPSNPWWKDVQRYREQNPDGTVVVSGINWWEDQPDPVPPEQDNEPVDRGDWIERSNIDTSPDPVDYLAIAEFQEQLPTWTPPEIPNKQDTRNQPSIILKDGKAQLDTG